MEPTPSSASVLCSALLFERGHFAGLAPSLLSQAGMEGGRRKFSSVSGYVKEDPMLRVKENQR